MLTIIRGLPGSGKSTYAHNHCFGGALVIEGDQRFVHPDGKYVFDHERDDTYTYIEDILIVAFMHKLKHVIVTTSSGHVASIQRYVDLAIKYGHKVRVGWLDHMNGAHYNTHGVPKDVIDRMKSTWELYPGESYLRRVLSGGADGSAYAIKVVKDPPPWFLEIQKQKGRNNEQVPT